MDAKLHADVQRLSDAASAALGAEVLIRAGSEPAAPATLSPAERQHYAQLPTAARRLAWLRGRGVLKPLLRDLGLDSNTQRYTPPHPRWSLSHSGELAVAAGLPAATVSGLGIDLELVHRPSLKAARLFLDTGEQAALATLATDEIPAVLQRLWCIKEAAFKANPQNRGTGLYQYRVADSHSETGGARSGTVRCTAPGAAEAARHIRYICQPFGNGSFAAAITH